MNRAIWALSITFWRRVTAWGQAASPVLCRTVLPGSPVLSCQGWGLRGCRGHEKFRVKALRTGFFIQRFYTFSLLFRLYSFIFWHWKVPIVVYRFFGVYGRAAALYESSRSCHLVFAWASPPSLAARQWGAKSAYGKEPQKDFGTNIFLGWKCKMFTHCINISAIPGSFLL